MNLRASAGRVCSFFWKEQACETPGCAKYPIRGFRFWLQGVGTEQEGSCVTPGADLSCHKGKSTRWEPSMPSGARHALLPALPQLQEQPQPYLHPANQPHELIHGSTKQQRLTSPHCLLGLMPGIKDATFIISAFTVQLSGALRSAHLSVGKNQNWESEDLGSRFILENLG